MIPGRVGDYRAIKFNKPAGSSDGFVCYQNSEKKIYLRFNKFLNEHQLQQKMNAAKSNSMAAADFAKTDIDGDNKFVLYGNKQRFFFAWNRDLYYFDLISENGKDEVDSFMKLFPY
jgi:hypothetical protein